MDEAVLLVSAEVIAELRRVLARPKFERFTPLYNRELAFDRYASLAQLVLVTHTVTDCRDPTDKFLALALSGRADLIPTGDDDLLVLHPWRSIPILSPAAFLAQHA